MKRNLLFLLLLFFSFSCKKQDLPFVPCNIQQIISITPHTGERVVNDFTYNSFGAPVKIITSHPATGNTSFAFKYDQWNRLISKISFFRNESELDYVTKYFYGNNGLIISDSTYLPFGKSQKTDYFYDEKLRVSKINVYGPYVDYTREFKYDSRGNLITYPGQVYDDKVNIHRTNPVWMFLDRDYSMNNPLPSTTDYQVAYNKKGLITLFKPGADFYSGPSLLTFRVNEVVYDCEGKNNKFLH